MREIRIHRIDVSVPRPIRDLNDALTIMAVDDPGPGGANHRYLVKGGDPQMRSVAEFVHCDIRFQNGALGDVGHLNGLSNEALIAIVIDRLEAFQRGPFKCDMNDQAVNHLHAALGSLHTRTVERIQRGVEGTLQQ